ncbi:VOC family protein [Streptacidiphilus neutrinimicus]|uniref:VOC family protein n=1 Tax=Streptacidiphilus neutrinimicus TaxID=105420 RepID=UPI0005A6DC9E|nr:glyoxalase/bleomycin resistance/dioxygenase family protein [Streptacidiphilus neutrinimicus]
MRILGLTFVGTSTAARAPMSDFLRTAFGLHTVDVDGVDADVFDLPDGTSFAVADAGGMGTERTVGFLVEGLDEAVERLRALGLDVDPEISANERWRYTHFRAPDGHLYELVETRSDATARP